MKFAKKSGALTKIISRDNLVSAVAAQLQAFSIIPTQSLIKDIQFTDLSKDPIEITVIFKEEVSVTKF